ncbi:MAG: hypothetical protein AAF726_03040 [Planctomycetota bacterium]
MRISQRLALLIAVPSAFSQATVDSSPDTLDWFRAIDGTGEFLVGDDVAPGGSVAVLVDLRGATPVETELTFPPTTRHDSTAVSDGGGVVAGWYVTSNGFFRGVRWDAATQVPNFQQMYYGLAMSGDGSTLVLADSFQAPASFRPSFRIVDGSSDALGQVTCTPATPNSTGVPAALSAAGVDYAAANDVEPRAQDMPPGSLTLFLASQTSGAPATPPNSVGSLCLGGAIGRYVGSGQAGAASGAGTRSLRLDLADTPQPTGSVSVAAGETWAFQAWYRDSVGGQATSNLSPAVEVVFR